MYQENIMRWRNKQRSWTFCEVYITTMETYCDSCKKYIENENSKW